MKKALWVFGVAVVVVSFARPVWACGSNSGRAVDTRATSSSTTTANGRPPATTTPANGTGSTGAGGAAGAGIAR